jgi:hypothetical protein
MTAGVIPIAPVTTREATAWRVWGMLVYRPVLAFAFQAALAAGFLIAGAVDPWRAAADWWLATFTLVNASGLVLLHRAMRAESRSLRDLYHFHREDRGSDLRWLVLALVVAGPLGYLPGVALVQLLWNGAPVGADMAFVAIPLWGAVLVMVAFPVLQGAAELPSYFGYVMPRLQARYGWRARALLLTAGLLAAQHVFLPLLFDWGFVAWRGLAFLPLALWFGWLLQRRPTLLPYLCVAHALLDATLPLFVLTASL